jgi:hypothetical protein
MFIDPCTEVGKLFQEFYFSPEFRAHTIKNPIPGRNTATNTTGV